MQVCELARDAECGAPACAGGRLVRPGEGLCFAEGFAAWLAAGNATLPLPRSQFLSALLAFASLPAMQAAYPGQLGARFPDPGCWMQGHRAALLGRGRGVCALLMLGAVKHAPCQECTALDSRHTSSMQQ